MGKKMRKLLSRCLAFAVVITALVIAVPLMTASADTAFPIIPETKEGLKDKYDIVLNYSYTGSTWWGLAADGNKTVEVDFLGKKDNGKTGDLNTNTDEPMSMWTGESVSYYNNSIASGSGTHYTDTTSFFPIRVTVSSTKKVWNSKTVTYSLFVNGISVRLTKEGKINLSKMPLDRDIELYRSSVWVDSSIDNGVPYIASVFLDVDKNEVTAPNGNNTETINCSYVFGDQYGVKWNTTYEDNDFGWVKKSFAIVDKDGNPISLNGVRVFNTGIVNITSAAAKDEDQIFYVKMTVTYDRNKERISTDISEPITIKAKTYTVTFQDENGNELGKAYYKMGATSLNEKDIPALPTKEGYTYSWPRYTLNNGNIIVKAIRTPIEYTATFKNGDEVVGTQKFTLDTKSLTEPALVAKDGYTAKWEDYKIEAKDMTINAKYIPIEYTATFKNGNDVVGTQKFTIETKSLTEPAVPAKDGYRGAWESYTLGLEDITINAKYSIIEYTATFKNGDDIVGTDTFTVNDMSITEPDVPAKTGYAGAWESYTLGFENIIINAEYTPIEYTATFKNGDDIVGTQKFTVETKSLTEPTVPAKAGYNGKWSDYTIEAKDMTINAEYSIIEYTATFKNGDDVVGEKTFTVNNMSVTEPDVPAKTGYTGAWESYTLTLADITINAEYTAIEYKATFVADKKEISVQNFTVETYASVVAPTVPAKTGYAGAWEAYTLSAKDITINAEYTPIEYTATFKNGDDVVGTQKFTVETKSLTEPTVPAKAGYNGKWSDYTIEAKDMTINAEYSIIEYTATFKNGDDVVGKKTFTVNNMSITEPEVPAKDGYRGTWEKYTLGLSDITINAEYSIINYTATFKNGDVVVGTDTFTVNDMSITEPEVPAKDGYRGTWEKYTLGLSDITINAEYSIIEYTATFKNGDDVVGTDTFTVNDMSITEPDVPAKTGYTGAWEKYTLGLENIIINAEYTPITYTATFVVDGKTNSTHKFTILNKDEFKFPAVPELPGKKNGAWDKTELTLEDLTITAQYENIVYTATFVVEGKTHDTQTFTVDDLATYQFPAVPEVEGKKDGKWDKTKLPLENVTITAQYTNIIYTAKFVADGVEVGSPQTFTVETYASVVAPTVPAKTGYTGTWPQYTLSAKDITITAKYVANKYTATFVADGVQVGSPQEFTVETYASVVVPTVPAKTGYTGAWKAFTLSAKDITIEAVYTPITYTAKFVADGVEVDSQDFTVESYASVVAPTVPAKTGYTGAWQQYTLSAQNETINAVYTAIPYTAKFMADGVEIDSQNFTVETFADVINPTVPDKTGYTGVWETYTLGASDIDINVVYTPITYTATFVADGVDVDSQDFTVETFADVINPTVPAKTGYTGAWEVYTLGANDITINAVYTLNTYSVTFEDGYTATPIDTQTVDHGTAATAPAAPTRSGYDFAGWDVAFDNITGDTVVTATWTQQPISIDDETPLGGNVNGQDGSVTINDETPLASTNDTNSILVWALTGTAALAGTAIVRKKHEEEE